MQFLGKPCANIPLSDELDSDHALKKHIQLINSAKEMKPTISKQNYLHTTKRPLTIHKIILICTKRTMVV